MGALYRFWRKSNSQLVINLFVHSTELPLTGLKWTGLSWDELYWIEPNWTALYCKVIVDKPVSQNKVVLPELTVLFDSAHGLDDARKRKVDRYERLAMDIEENCPLEVGWRGLISARNCGVLATLATMRKGKDFKDFRLTPGKIALLGSHRIWTSRKSQTFVGGSFMLP